MASTPVLPRQAWSSQTGSPMTMAGRDLLFFLSHGYLGAFVRTRA